MLTCRAMRAVSEPKRIESMCLAVRPQAEMQLASRFTPRNTGGKRSKGYIERMAARLSLNVIMQSMCIYHSGGTLTRRATQAVSGPKDRKDA